MRFILMFALVLGVFSAEPLWAACGPPKCPVPEDPSPTPQPIPSPNQEISASGYFEVASPDCLQADYVQSVKGAEENAFRQARMLLRSANVVQVESFFYTQRCGQSIYAGSFQGNSWIIQAFAKFRRGSQPDTKHLINLN